MNVDISERFGHSSWIAALGTGAAYLLILLGMFILLFVAPYIIFTNF